MIEPELAFADLEDDMACATAYLQYVVCYLPIFCPQFNINIRITLYSVRLAIFAAVSLWVYFIVTTASCMKVKYILEKCKEDMDFFNTWIEKGIIGRLSV